MPKHPKKFKKRSKAARKLLQDNGFIDVPFNIGILMHILVTLEEIRDGKPSKR